MSAMQPCPYCRGTGQIAVDQCEDIVGDGSRCRRPRINDPAYFEQYPDRAQWNMYCTRHHYVRVRQHHLRERAP